MNALPKKLLGLSACPRTQALRALNQVSRVVSPGINGEKEEESHLLGAYCMLSSPHMLTCLIIKSHAFILCSLTQMLLMPR